MKTFASILLYDVLVCDGARCDNVNYVYSYGVTRRMSILSITSFKTKAFLARGPLVDFINICISVADS